MSDKVDLKIIIKQDKTLLNAKKQLERIMDDYDPEEWLDELFSLHASRGVSALNANSILQSSLRVLVDSSVQEMAVHSRVTAIKMQSLRKLLVLEEILDPLKKYMLVTYGNMAKEGGSKSLTLQKDTVDIYLKAFYRETKALDYVCKICELLHKDLDSASWNLKRIQETLEVSARDK